MNYRWIQISLLISILFFVILAPRAYAADKKQSKMKEVEFLTTLEQTIGEENMKIVLGEEVKKKGIITKERAAFFLARAEEVFYETSFEEEFYKICIKKKRIYDYFKIQERYKAGVLKVYMKGIMVGDSNGMFSGSRTFSPKAYLTIGESEEVLKRFANPKSRKKLSPDGQLLRTTNLPKNDKLFPYILASFPNSYYEAGFAYEGYEPALKEGRDYTNPINVKDIKITKIPGKVVPMSWAMEQYQDQWVKKVKNNMEARFNVDYRTIDKDHKWYNKLHDSYYFYKNDPDNYIDKVNVKEMKDYIKWVKKNHLVMKGIVRLDKSSFYTCQGGYYFRVYVKFKVASIDQMPKKTEDLFYSCSHLVVLRPFKKGVWIEKYFDIAVGSPNGYSLGEDYALCDDALVDSAY